MLLLEEERRHVNVSKHNTISDFNPYKIDGRDLHLDLERDFHAQGMEGNVFKTRYLGRNVRSLHALSHYCFAVGQIKSYC